MILVLLQVVLGNHALSDYFVVLLGDHFFHFNYCIPSLDSRPLAARSRTSGLPRRQHVQVSPSAPLLPDNGADMASPSSRDEESLSKVGATGTVLDLDELGQKEGYILDSSHAQGGLKTTADGRTILIPQPSDDVNDPLNWSQFKKNVVLVVISAMALVPDYGSATGAVALLPQAA